MCDVCVWCVVREWCERGDDDEGWGGVCVMCVCGV